MENAIVSTLPDRCKRCYSCIRECPAKAIKVINGQATVIQERCIACGHCVKVCSQNAKRIISDVEKTSKILSGNEMAIAIVAPSFAASFPDTFSRLPAALRKLGFTKVVETAFGADLISEYYRKEFESKKKKTIISSACPAVVNYIEKYYPELVPNLAKVVSPMIAIGKYLRENTRGNVKIIFIGPCIAKKQEYIDDEVGGIIDGVLTFTEVKDLFTQNKIILDEIEESEFDSPHAYLGKTYPLAGGLLKTANISGDILEREIIVVEGKNKVTEIIDEIAGNKIQAKFIDILFCEGCISGPAVDSNLNYYSKREKVISYIEKKIHSIDKQIWKSNVYNSRGINFTRNFNSKWNEAVLPTKEKIKEILEQTNKYSEQDELNCGACGYNTCTEYASAVARNLAEIEMCLPYLVDSLKKAYNDLSETQEQLRTAEKLASIGQLSAGIAHEINNPLGSILIYAALIKKHLAMKFENVQDTHDLELIIGEANRCKNIVSNLLNFARQGRLFITKFSLSMLIDETIKTVGMNDRFAQIKILIDNTAENEIVEGDRDQLKQVYLNLLNNACEASADSLDKKIIVKIYCEEDSVITEIIDKGMGIARENFGRIFTPFFTTKNFGKGTGLGLAISYGIIKMHNGEITFQSDIGKGTAFKVKLLKNIYIKNLNLN